MIQKYIDLITSEYKTKSKFISSIKAVLKVPLEIDDTTALITSAFDIDKAVGKQLDVLGQILGFSRTLKFDPEYGEDVLDDETYRLCLKSQVAINETTGTRLDFVDTMSIIFPDNTFGIVDNQDMSILVIYIADSVTPLVRELVEKNILFPKFSGVKVNYTISEGTIFAWDSDSGIFGGWNEGTWL